MSCCPWYPPVTRHGRLSVSLLLLLVATVTTESVSQVRSDRAGALRTAVAAGSETELQRVEASFPGTEEAALAHLLRGYQRLQAKDYGNAASLLADPQIARRSLLDDYAIFYRAQALLGASRSEEAESEYMRLAQTHPSSLLARQARRKAAESAITRGAFEVAIRLLSPLVAEDDGTALSLKADALEKLGRTGDAIATLRRLHFYAPQSSEATEVAQRLTALGSSTAPATALEERARADKLYDAGLFVLAAQSYDLLARQFPSAATNEVWLRAGISNYKISSAGAAIDALARVRARTPKEQSEALYYTASSQIALRRVDAALQTLADLRRTAPDSQRVADLLYDLARSADRADQTSQAASYYEQLIKQFPRDDRADDAHFWLAWRLHQAKDYAQSSQRLLEHLASYGEQTDNRGKAAFWAAVDAERSGAKSRALTLYRALLKRYNAGWYGLNAERRIAQLERSGVKAQLPEPGSVLERAIAALQDITITHETLNSAGVIGVNKAEQLMRVALLQPAMDELQALRETAPNSPLLCLRVAQVFRARNEGAAAINTLRRAYPDYGQTLPEEMTREVWEVFYPLNWWSTIQQESRRHNLDPYLVAGIIRQETIFNPQARSRANALGLMQLLPSTGQLVARKYSLGGGRITSADLFNPILNIQLGTAYLSDLIADFGRFDYAAVAYNGGPTRTARWLRELPTAEIEEWVDSIPISETRNYVQGVHRNARQYQRLYDEQGRFRSIVPER